MTGAFSMDVAAPSFRGASKASEPGIQKNFNCFWIPGSALGAAPE
jgi:hypothetical protein